MYKFIAIIILILSSNLTYSQVIQEWVKKYNGTGNHTDQVAAMTTDNAGNVYVTGNSSSSNQIFTEDYVTIKYNSSGDTAWVKRYNGTGNSSDIPFDIAVDNSGNVYVTGYSVGTSGSSDCYTIKYNSSGVQLWAQRYGGNGQDAAYAIALDESGNVYITGISDTSSSGATGNFLTIKYNSNGIQQWARMYNSPGNLRDLANDISVDNSGNVYVTGYATISTNNLDYLTVKYSSSGDFVWAKEYNGPGNDRDIARYITLVNDNGIYVCGSSRNSAAFYTEDYLTIKYDSSGNALWTQRYNSPQSYGDLPEDMKVDGSGNVYVTGYGTNGSTYSMATVKYNSSGNQEWVRGYPGIALSYGMALDNSGNIYITGAVNLNSDCITIKYNPQGSQQWAHIHDGLYVNTGLAVSVNNSGVVFVAGNTSEIHGSGQNSDFMVMKYSNITLFQSQFTRNANKLITDNTNLYDTITVDYSSTADFSVTDVNLRLDTILHTNDSDLEIYLIHNNLTDTAVYHAGGSGDNFINTVLNDSASVSVSGGSAPFTGSYRPVKPLSQFNGGDVNGTWILKIYDSQTGNTGVLKSWSLIFTVQNNTIGINNISNEVPSVFSLSQNYPNPFNPVTSFKFTVPWASFVRLAVYDILGREMETIFSGNLQPGTFSADWNASQYPSGVYFYRLETPELTQTRKMILTK